MKKKLVDWDELFLHSGRSIFVEHCLDGLRIMCLGQSQLKQDTCLLRVQRGTVDEVLVDVGLFGTVQPVQQLLYRHENCG